MKTKTITLYEYSELSDKAKEKALNNWNEYNDDPFMQSDMINLLKEKLKDRGIKYDADSIDVRYSLTHCQGDGFMFIGTVEWNGDTIHITQNDSYYCHMYTARFDLPEYQEYGEKQEKQLETFEAIYQEICKEMERIGYQHIKEFTSEESFMEACDANEYTFRENGVMENI